VRHAVSMSTPIPQPLRAAAGLAALAIDSARKLPSQVVGFPVLALSAALQASLKAQQRYAELVARGDQLLGQLRPPGEGAPPWVRFDDEPVVGEAPADGARPASAFDAAPDPLEELLDEEAAELLGTGEPDVASLADAEAGLDTGLTGLPGLPGLTSGPDAGAGPAGWELRDLAAGSVPDPVPAGASGPAEPGTDRPDAVGPGAVDLDPDAELADRERVERELAELGADPAPEVRTDTRSGKPTRPAGGAGAGGSATATADPRAGEPTTPAADARAGGRARPAAEPAGAEAAGADPTAYDGYLAAEPPLPRYDELSIPQLRGRLRTLDEARLEQLVAYERAHAARAPYLTMLENRLTTLRSR